MSIELNFTEEAIPTIVRESVGREPEKWENHLAPLKADDKAGKSFRVWQYGKKTGATSRVASVRKRLVDATPEDNWTLAVREVPGADPTEYGVYVKYNGTFTPEQVAENAAARQKRSDSIKAVREAAAAASAAVATAPPVDPAPVPEVPSTPAAKVAAARKAQGGGK